MTYCILLRDPDGRQEILEQTVLGPLPVVGHTIVYSDARRLRVEDVEHTVRKDTCGVIVSGAVVLVTDPNAKVVF